MSLTHLNVYSSRTMTALALQINFKVLRILTCIIKLHSHFSFDVSSNDENLILSEIPNTGPRKPMDIPNFLFPIMK